MRDLLIGGRRIADDTDPYVIADTGHDPWSDLERAEVLFLQAAMAGAQAIVLSADAMTALVRYDEPDGTPYGRPRPGSAARRQFGRIEYARVAELAADLRVDLVPTVADLGTVRFLAEVDPNVPAVRVAPAAITDRPLLTATAKLGRPVLLGVYNATREEVAGAVDAVRSVHPELALVQCATPQPKTPLELNLAGIVTLLADHPGVVVGFSGHDVDPEQSWIAYAVGARLIEKRVSTQRPARGRRPTLDPLGLIRYDGQSRWGDSVAPVRATGS
jgi:N-acetylneuraminate synthase/sialic acid synthase